MRRLLSSLLFLAATAGSTAALAQTQATRVTEVVAGSTLQTMEAGAPASSARPTQLCVTTNENGAPSFYTALVSDGIDEELSLEAAMYGVGPDKQIFATRVPSIVLERRDFVPPISSGMYLQLDSAGGTVNNAGTADSLEYATGAAVITDRMHPIDAFSQSESMLAVILGRAARGVFSHSGTPCSYSCDIVDDGGIKMRYYPTCDGVPNAGSLELLISPVYSVPGIPLSATVTVGGSVPTAGVDTGVLYKNVFDRVYAPGDADVTYLDVTGGNTNVVLDLSLLNEPQLPSLIFADGFESGNTSNWSSVQP